MIELMTIFLLNIASNGIGSWLQAQNIELPTKHIIWNDRCASQFKCTKAWFHVSRYQTRTKNVGLPWGCVMDWNYFGTCHGKGQWDGAVTHVKNVLQVEQVKTIGTTKLQNASNECNFLQANMGKAHFAYLGTQWQVR
jgi:hypothetical protein